VGFLLLLGAAGLLFWGLRATPPSTTSTDQQFTVPGFGNAPAIAVLPFDNLSGDPEQEYFADGMAEELITRLSSWREVPVIARNSSFVYKGKAVDVKQVSRELGVRYVVEGSVRKTGGRVRISAQLIDATTGRHLWAQTYDRTLRDLFEIQDDITEAIAGSLQYPLMLSEMRRAIRKESKNLDAYDLRMRARWHMSKMSSEDNRKGRALLERAIELDPEDPEGWADLAFSHYLDNMFQWTDSPARSLAEQFRTAERCVRLDNTNDGCHWALAWAHSLNGQRDQAIAAAELAVEFQPSSALAHQTIGLFLAVTGRAEEGIAHQKIAMRLSPRALGTSYFLHCIALAHFAEQRYREAVSWESGLSS
jgi:adenylate cyclase